MTTTTCKFCGQPSPDEGAICELCFDRGLHLLDDELQAHAAAAMHAVGTRVEITYGDMDVEGVVVGCQAGQGGRDGQDLWTVFATDGSFHDALAGDCHVLDPTV